MGRHSSEAAVGRLVKAGGDGKAVPGSGTNAQAQECALDGQMPPAEPEGTKGASCTNSILALQVTGRHLGTAAPGGIPESRAAVDPRERQRTQKESRTWLHKGVNHGRRKRGVHTAGL